MEILDKLERKDVVSFVLSENKKFLLIQECCDYCFTEALDKIEALQLIEELKELINLMEE